MQLGLHIFVDDFFQFFPICATSAHFFECSIRLVEQVCRSIKFQDVSALSENEDAVVVDDGLEPMGDGDHHGACQLRPDGLLDLGRLRCEQRA